MVLAVGDAASALVRSGRSNLPSGSRRALDLLPSEPVMTRSHFLGSCILLLGSAVGCASDPTEDVDAARQAKIIGDKDLTVVSQDGANVPGRYRPATAITFPSSLVRWV